MVMTSKNVAIDLEQKEIKRISLLKTHDRLRKTGPDSGKINGK
jgi:hypothetical protein